MKSRIEEEIRPPPKRAKWMELANVKCMECHCEGSVMKTIDGIVLYPNKVKKTLLELGGGIFLPNIKKAVPTVKIANSKAKKFIEGFNQVESDEEEGENSGCFRKPMNGLRIFRDGVTRGIENARGEKKMTLVEMMEREKRKTRAKDVPDRFTGFFSDEFEKDNFWKSKKRFSLQ